MSSKEKTVTFTSWFIWPILAHLWSVPQDTLTKLTRSLLTSEGLNVANADGDSYLPDIYFQLNMPPSICLSLRALDILHGSPTCPCFCICKSHLTTFAITASYFFIWPTVIAGMWEESMISSTLLLLHCLGLHSCTNAVQQKPCPVVSKLTGRKMLIISRLKMQGGICSANLFRGAILVICVCLVMTKKCKAFPHSFRCLPGGCVINKETLAAKGLAKPISMVLKKIS